MGLILGLFLSLAKPLSQLVTQLSLPQPQPGEEGSKEVSIGPWQALEVGGLRGDTELACNRTRSCLPGPAAGEAHG